MSNLAATLSKAEAEVSRLKEWQDVFKRMADDKAQEAVQELNACKAHAAERQAAARGEPVLVRCLQTDGLLPPAARCTMAGMMIGG